jgi:hypothetical protein
MERGDAACGWGELSNDLCRAAGAKESAGPHARCDVWSAAARLRFARETLTNP